MRKLYVVAVAVLLGLSALALAGQAHSYAKPLETTWDEAVKAVRDAEYYVSDSNRDQHWFVMHTKRKRGYELRVELMGSDTQTTVQVAAVDPDDEEDTVKHVRKYLDALDRRMD